MEKFDQKFGPFIAAVVAAAVIAFVAYATLAEGAEAWIPALQGRVNDYAGALTPAQRSALERRLVNIDRSKADNPQVVVLITKSLEGHTVEQYAHEVFHAWRLGSKERDDGVLLVLAPAERRMRIEVGYGLEGKLPDLRAKQILVEMLGPDRTLLKKGQENWPAAIEIGVEGIAKAMK